MKYSVFLLSTFFWFIFLHPCQGVKQAGTKQKSSEEKARKKQNKLVKKIDAKLKKWEAKEGGILNEKPRPWLALALSDGAFLALFVSILASFGLQGGLTVLMILLAYGLAVLGLLTAIRTLNRHKDSEKPKLTKFIATLAAIISGLILALMTFALFASLAS